MFINCTPHPITLNNTTIPPCGHCPRVEEQSKLIEIKGDVQIMHVDYSSINWDGLEVDPKKNYIVSSMVLDRTNLPNFYSPYGLIRDGGVVIGCKSLRKN